ncbi:MucR family transcriptional regulator [Sphingomonas aquatilis]|jgi:predicted transcriptional regulator|uniref:MucR family transcriptional regulator n=1 Tax=Sphingomonas aquatilis TaxID=93063 RepID=UPI0023F6586E|nr:MucR family transcriptional regulator [Sphingomonas aquatilis]MCI4655902.1 MucR family transcriptional regulator [Sphingomonas aquatilis]
MADDTALNSVELAAALTIAWLGNQHNLVSADDVPAFLKTMHEAVERLASNTNFETDANAATRQEAAYTPAISVRKSLASSDHITSMIDGKPYRSLRRRLSTNGLTPDEYRQRDNLKTDYPMVSPSYSESRRTMAEEVGLGGKPKASETVVEEKPAPRRRGKAGA